MQFVIRLMKAMTCATSQSPLGVVIVYLLRMILLLPTAPRLDGDGSTFWSDLSHVLAPITGAVMLRHQKKKRKKKKAQKIIIIFLFLFFLLFPSHIFLFDEFLYPFLSKYRRHDVASS